MYILGLCLCLCLHSHVDDGRVQRDSLLAERLQLTDRAVKLGQERAAFEVSHCFSLIAPEGNG
jgi:hypothetical protein